MKRWAWILVGALTVFAAVAVWATRAPLHGMPDPVWLEEVVVPDEPSVQLILDAIPYSGRRAVHPYFLARGADQEVHRYEVWQQANSAGSHLWVDENAPLFSMGVASFAWAEITGDRALVVIQVLESGYPCAGQYTMLPGPNSNTYAAWVLEQSGWDVTLPEQALGQSWGCSQAGF